VVAPIAVWALVTDLLRLISCHGYLTWRRLPNAPMISLTSPTYPSFQSNNLFPSSPQRLDLCAVASPPFVPIPCRMAARRLLNLALVAPNDGLPLLPPCFLSLMGMSWFCEHPHLANVTTLTKCNSSISCQHSPSTTMTGHYDLLALQLPLHQHIIQRTISQSPGSASPNWFALRSATSYIFHGPRRLTHSTMYYHPHSKASTERRRCTI